MDILDDIFPDVLDNIGIFPKRTMCNRVISNIQCGHFLNRRKNGVLRGVGHEMFGYVSRLIDVLQKNMNFCVRVFNRGEVRSSL